MARADTPTEKSADDGILELIKGVAEGSIVLAAFLFLAGWSYIYGYYRSFGLSLGDFDLPAAVTLTFSFPVIFRWPVLLVIFATALVYLVLRRHATRWHIPSSLLLLVFLAIAAGLVSTLGQQFAMAKARRDMVEQSSTLPRVTTLTTNVEGKGVAPLCSEASGAKPHFRLLLHTHDSFFLFEPPFLTPNDEIKDKNLSLCIIPQERIRSVLLELPAKGK